MTPFPSRLQWLSTMLPADNLWWSSENGTIGYHPNLEAPRCLPCGYSSYGEATIAISMLMAT